MGPISYQWEKGQWQSISGIPLTDRGFRHGMSVFETIAIRSGRFVFLDEHLEKLRHACAAIGLVQPPGDIAFKLVPLHFLLGTARLYITAGDGHFRSPMGDGRILLSIEEVSETPAAPRTLSISTSTHNSAWPSLKTGNYWPNISAYRQAPEHHAEEIVLVNSANHVISASLANLFAVIDGLLLTPRVSSGARAGVLRDWVIAREDVIIGDFHPEQLREASEIFLTGSGYGIAPMAKLENKFLASQSLGERLRLEYLEDLKTL